MLYGNNDWRDYVAHSNSPWKAHRYVKKIGEGKNARYIYPEDLKNNTDNKWGKHADRWKYLTDTKTKLNPVANPSNKARPITSGAGKTDFAKKAASKDRIPSYQDYLDADEARKNKKRREAAMAMREHERANWRWRNYQAGKKALSKGKVQVARRHRLNNRLNMATTPIYG